MTRTLSDWTRETIQAKPAHLRRPNQPPQPYMRLPRGARRLLRVERMREREEDK